MEKKLYRNTSDQAIAGVAAGLARYFEIDVTWIRIFFILATIFGASGLLIYIILWIAIPEQPFGQWNMPGQTDYKVKDTAASSFETDYKAAKSKRKRESGFISGVILIALGSFFLLDQFELVPDWVSFGKLWPLALIIPGLVMLVNTSKNAEAKPVEATEPVAPVAEEKVAPKKPVAKKPIAAKKPVVRKTKKAE
jgi:phage shock protein PspC (stress-responsive transcriptional regulator)